MAEPGACAAWLLSRDRHGRVAGAWPVERRGHPDPAGLHHGSWPDTGADPSDLGLLRRDVWRADIVDPAEHPRRRAGHDDLSRRAPDGPEGHGRRGPGAVGHRVFRGRILRHMGPCASGTATCQDRAAVRAGRVFRPVRPGLHDPGRRVLDQPGQGGLCGGTRPRACHHRRRYPDGCAALYLRRGASLRRA